jgi:hypothetical protein
MAEAVAPIELDVARVHEGIAEQGGSLAAQAREHAKRAREFAAREHAEVERLRRVGRAEDRWREGATSASKSMAGSEPARRTTGRAGWCWLLALEQPHVGGLGAFRPWRHVELDGLALIK